MGKGNNVANVAVAIPAEPFNTMPLHKLHEHIKYLDRLVGEAARAEFDAKRRFEQYNQQIQYLKDLLARRRAAMTMEPVDRLIALVEDLTSRGWHDLATHCSNNWAEDDGVVIISNLEQFDEHNRASLVTAAVACGFSWHGW
jgi:hypothetical protein